MNYRQYSGYVHVILVGNEWHATETDDGEMLFTLPSLTEQCTRCGANSYSRTERKVWQCTKCGERAVETMAPDTTVVFYS